MTRASSPINDFGQLFFGFNLFLILSALFLVSIFSGFAIERRRSQQGLLVAVGFTPQAVHRIILLEFGIVSFVGCLAGLVGALGLAELLLSGLMGPWQDAVGVLALNVHVSLRTLLQGAGAMWLVAMGAAWLGVRSTLAATAWSNLRGVSLGKNVRSFTGVGLQRWVGPVLLALAVGAALFSDAARGPSAALVYFGCGGLVLVGCLLLVWTWLQTPGTDMPTSLLTVGVAGLRVRPKSSFAVVSVVALGLYMVGGIGGGSLQPRIESTDRHSGTGGFAWMAQTSVPIQADLASAHGLEIHGLASSMVPDQAIGLGLFAGDDASCMNMGSAQTPSLLGVQTEAFDRRDVFQFLEPSAASWRVLLEGPEDATVIPVVGDAATVHWGLHLKVGDELETVDEYGGTLRLQIAAVVDNWIFQGALVADREKLALRFPSRRGDSMFLIDSTSSSDGLVTKIDERLADYGVVLQRPVTVLEGYRRVERTYMLIFGVLGGLGVLLAVVGVVALSYRRSVEAGRDRALLMALGFTREQVRTLGLAEMSALMAAGMFCGVLATVVALLPRLMLMDWTALFRFLFLACTILVVGFVGVGIVSRVTGGRGDVESIHRNQ